MHVSKSSSMFSSLKNSIWKLEWISWWSHVWLGDSNLEWLISCHSYRPILDSISCWHLVTWKNWQHWMLPQYINSTRLVSKLTPVECARAEGEQWEASGDWRAWTWSFGGSGELGSWNTNRWSICITTGINFAKIVTFVAFCCCFLVFFWKTLVSILIVGFLSKSWQIVFVFMCFKQRALWPC